MKLSAKPSHQKFWCEGKLPNWYIWLTASASFLGFLDAAYLTAKHFSSGAVPCSLALGCEKVLASSYSTLYMMPLALWGAIYYLLIFLSAIAYADFKKEIFAKILLFLPAAGFLVSAALIYIQAFVLHSFCTYCLFSAFISTLLFSTSAIVCYNNYKALKYV